MVFRAIIYIISLIFISACANRFEVGPDISENLSSIEIRYDQNTPEDYEFISYFNRILGSNLSNKKYYLDLQITKTSSGLVIQKDSDPVRETLELNTNFKLLEVGNDKPIYEGKVRLFNSYNTLFSPYSTDLEMHKSTEDVYKATALEIRRRLIMFFKQRNI